MSFFPTHALWDGITTTESLVREQAIGAISMLSFWSIFWSTLLGALVYDQCKFLSCLKSPDHSQNFIFYSVFCAFPS